MDFNAIPVDKSIPNQIALNETLNMVDFNTPSVDNGTRNQTIFDEILDILNFNTSTAYNATSNQTPFEMPVNNEESNCFIPFHLMAIAYIFSYFLAIFGIVSNALNIAVYRKYTKKTSTIIALIALSVVDSILSALSLIVTLRIYVFTGLFEHFFVVHGHFIPVGHTIFNVAKVMSLWLVAYLSMERSMAVWFPRQFKKWFSKQRAIYYLVFLFTFSIVFNIPKLLRFVVYTYFDPCLNQTVDGYKYTEIGNNYQFKLIYGVIMQLGFVYLLPMLTIIASGGHLIWLLGANSKNRIGQIIKLPEKRIMKMTVAISIISFICYSPDILTQLTVNFESIQLDKGIIYGVSVIAYSANGALNIFVYSMTASKFREGFKKLLGIKPASLVPLARRPSNRNTTIPSTSDKDNDSQNDSNQASKKQDTTTGSRSKRGMASGGTGRSGPSNPGPSNPGPSNTGASNSGASNSGACNSGANNSGASNSGASKPGTSNLGVDNSVASNSGAGNAISGVPNLNNSGIDSSGSSNSCIDNPTFSKKASESQGTSSLDTDNEGTVYKCINMHDTEIQDIEDNTDLVNDCSGSGNRSGGNKSKASQSVTILPKESESGTKKSKGYHIYTRRATFSQSMANEGALKQAKAYLRRMSQPEANPNTSSEKNADTTSHV